MPPRKKAKKLGESKQDFLKRCSAEAVEAGSTEAQAMAMCTASWNKQQLAAFVDDGVLRLSAPVELARAEGDGESAPRRFSVLAYTGKLIDWGYWGRFIIDLAGIQLSKTKVPALLNHDRDQIVGTIDTSSGDENGFYVAGSFSKVTDAAKEVLGLADESFPWQASIGVQATKIVQLAKDATMQVNGQAVTGPCDVWTESRVFETSFCPFGADDDTAAVSMAAETNPAPKGPMTEVHMNKKLRKLLEKLGLDPSSTEQEALAFMAGLDPETLSKELAAPAAAPADPAPAAPKPAAALSGKDVLELMERGKLMGIAEDKLRELAGQCASLDEATLQLVELMGQVAKPVGAGRVESGRTEAEKFALCAEDALCLRCNVRPETPAPGSTELQGFTLRELAREYLERFGVSVRSMDNKTLAGVALGVVRLGGMHTTSDFANILSNVAEKILQKAYEVAPSTWQAWCGVASGIDFKSVDRPQLSEAPSLELINEHGEYTYGGFTDFKETNQIKTYGRKFAITRQALINDDLGALQRIPRAFGGAAARRINDLVYAILTSNQTMAYDSVALFHADHSNLANPAAALSSTALGVGRTAMRKQTGPKGATLNIAPRYLLVPAALEMTADVLLRSVASTDSEKNAGVVNPWQNALVPVVEARLDATSDKSWYLAADPTQLDTVEVMFLDGVQTPYIEELAASNIDGREFKVRIDVGVRALDHRGMYKNAGA
jgi:hypothetical protein